MYDAFSTYSWLFLVASSFVPTCVLFLNFCSYCTGISCHPPCIFWIIARTTQRDDIHASICRWFSNIYMASITGRSCTIPDSALLWPLLSSLFRPILFPRRGGSSWVTLTSALDIFHLVVFN